jgi:hypothetical protein
MEVILVIARLYLIVPDGSPSNIATFTDKQIARRKSESVFLGCREVHLVKLR